MVFETQRLLAREWRLGDVDGAFRMYGDPEVTRYIGGHIEPDVDAMEKKLELLIERYKDLPDGHGGFPLILKQTGELVGAALLKELPDADKAPSGDIEIDPGPVGEVRSGLRGTGFGEVDRFSPNQWLRRGSR